MGGLGAASVSGPRPHNEDSFLARDLGESSLKWGDYSAFLLVCDGMGGYSHGDVASAAAVRAAMDYFDSLLEPASAQSHVPEPAAVITEAAHRADKAVRDAAQNAGATTVGATFVAAVTTPKRAWIGNIGDSRGYVLTREDARQITRDHSEVGRLMASGVLSEAQAQTHDGRNVIDRALGFPGAGDPDITAVDLDEDDVVLLCSDGLSTALTGEAMHGIVAGSPSLEVAAQTLVEGALHAGTDDNTTVVLWSPSAVPGWLSSPGATGPAEDSHSTRTVITPPSRRKNRWVTALVAALIFVAVAAAGVAGYAAYRVAATKPQAPHTQTGVTDSPSVTPAQPPSDSRSGPLPSTPPRGIPGPSTLPTGEGAR